MPSSKTRSTHAAVLVVAMLGLGACASPPSLMSGGTGATPATDSPLRQFPDIPAPAGATMNLDRTLVFGADPWFGQLSIAAKNDPATLFDFYRQNLPNHQWNELTAIRAPTSVLAYEREDRVMTLQITGGRFGGSDVLLTVSPRGDGQPKADPSQGGLMPPPVTVGQ